MITEEKSGKELNNQKSIVIISAINPENFREYLQNKDTRYDIVKIFHSYHGHNEK